MNALRLEKGFGTWAREFRPIYGPEEAGLGRFIDWGKGDFVGRGAAETAKADGGGPLRLVTFAIDAGDADAIGDEPVWHDGKVVGWVTSGGYGHGVGRSLALAYVPKTWPRRRPASRSNSSASAGRRSASTARLTTPAVLRCGRNTDSFRDEG